MTLAAGNMTYNGVTLGPGGIAQIASVDGLAALPASRTGDVDRPNAQGMLPGYDFMGTRSITLNLEVTATGGNTMAANLETLRAAFLMQTVGSGGINPTASQVLVFNFGSATTGQPGYNRQVSGRVRKLDALIDIAYAAGQFVSGIAVVPVLIECADPLIYDANIQSQSVGLQVAVGGLTFPATPPFTFGSSTGGFVTADNVGSIAGPMYVTINGPCINPRIEQQTTGVTVQFNTTLGASDVLVVDSYNGSAVLNGTASRESTLAPGSYITALTVVPGNNTIGFYSSDVTSTAATMTVEWSNTWA